MKIAKYFSEAEAIEKGILKQPSYWANQVFDPYRYGHPLVLIRRPEFILRMATCLDSVSRRKRLIAMMYVL